MTPYKQAIGDAMEMLAADSAVRFVGYGLLHGRAGGTLKNVPEAQIIETPTAENLMTGIAIGLSLRGLKPVLYFERADFLFNAMDAIVNHLNAMGKLSEGEFAPTCIIRVTIGNATKPLFTGPVHTQNPMQAMSLLMNYIPVVQLHRLKDRDGIVGIYKNALQALDRNGGHSTLIYEHKDLW